MALSNSQYDAIMRTYEETKFKNRHLMEERRDEVYQLIPEYQSLDSSIASLSVEQGKKLIMGDPDALIALRKKLGEMSRRKKQLLSEHGFPENYLEPIYSCPDCRDSGYINGQKCHCLKQAIIRTLYMQSNMESVLEKENFDKLSYDYYNDSEVELMRSIIGDCKSFVKFFDRSYENLLFYGAVGVGKTYLTNCIAKDLLENGHSVIYFTSFQLFDTLAKYAFRSADLSENIANIHEDIFSCDLLIIDDLGTETTNSFVSSQLFLLLNERDLRRKSTIISTNLSLEMLANRYSERNFSRIFGNYKMLKPDIQDIRIKMKKLKNRK
ncbi:MAG TPA: ATP-binding protein [Lachnospiraceae bacterium]|nr:ATP-binding protein [Lachnospiraceae bacterium]